MNMKTSSTKIERIIRIILVSKAAADLARTCKRTQLSETDIVNRAVSLYDFIDGQLAAGGELLLRCPEGPTKVIQLR